MKRTASAARIARAALRTRGLLAACLACASASAGAADATTPASSTPAPLQTAPSVAAPPVPELLGGLLTESRVLYPLQVGSWVAESEHRFPEQRLGVSVRYIDNRKRRWIDLYFYPAGLQTPNMLAAVAASERDSIALFASQSARAAELGELEQVALARGTAGNGGTVPAWTLGLAYPDEGMASAMLLFAQEMYLVKARASAAQPPATVQSLQSELQDFMQSVAGQVRIASTGACWLPTRIELAQHLPADEQTLAGYRDPGQDTAAAVVGGRVLVAQAQAARAPELALQLTRALYPGCVAPELIEPEVPPSLREIRIEYRLPLDASPDTRTPFIGSPRAPSRATG